MRSETVVRLSMLALVLVGAAPNNTPFTTWRDPREDAFHLGVPVGWKISGGTARAGAIDVRPFVRAESPDGTVKVFLNDPDLSPRQVPNAMMLQVGLREGQVIKSSTGSPILLARYQTGEQFARQYIGQKLCSRAQITQSGPVPSVSQEMNARIQPMATSQGVAAQVNVGEAYFRCGDAVGYTFANTLLLGAAAGGGAQIWAVYQLGSVLASDPAQAPFGAYVLHTMMETFALNPQWEARQAKLTQDVTGSVTQMQKAMAQSIAQHAQQQASSASAGGFNHPNNTRLPTDLRAKWAREDVSRQKFSDAIMGQHWEHNPTTGENVRVSNSSSYYWMDHSKNVVAGSADGNPPTGSQGQYTRLEKGWQ